MSLLRARKGPRTLLGLLAAMGLVAALAMPAMASHVEPEFVNGNPSCGDLGFSNELTIDVSDLTAGTTETFSNAFGSIDITASADLKSFDFANAEPPIDAIVIKAGSAGNLYAYDPPATADTGLVTPVNDGGQQAEVSHISVCFGVEAPPSEAPPSEPGEESEAPASEAPPSEPAESEREGELGGNPTPAPEIPDTAVGGDFGQMPATVLSLVLIGALAAMVYVRLARER